MTKAVLEKVDAELKRRRAQVSKLHAELEELEDYLDVLELEARHRSAGKRTYAQVEMEKRYRVAKL